MKELDELTAEVEDISGKADSIIGLCEKLSVLVAENKLNPAKLQALSDALKVKAQAIADAVAANPLPGDEPPAV